MTARIATIVLAGGPRDAVSALAPGVRNKAFVPVAGITLAARTIASLRSSPQIGRIVVVAPRVVHGDPALREADECRVDGTTMSASLRSGLRDLPPDEFALITASDLPILTRVAIEEFLALAQRTNADIVYACVERRTHFARFPDVPHTWARLQDGTFCGGGCVLMRPRAFDRLEVFLGRLGAARKNPLRLASIFGTPTLLRYALGRLTLAKAESRGSALIGVAVAAAVCTHAEIAVNVDRASDVALAERLIEEQFRSR